MIKGLISLFTSGLIFSPMVLLGVISGIAVIIKLDHEAIKALFAAPRFYALVAFVAAVYTVVFAKIYKEGGTEVDWPATTGLMVWNFARYFIAFVLSMSFMVMIAF